MNAWFAEIAIGIGASFAAMLLVKATLTLAVALAVTGVARRSRAAARHVLLVAAYRHGLCRAGDGWISTTARPRIANSAIVWWTGNAEIRGGPPSRLTPLRRDSQSPGGDSPA